MAVGRVPTSGAGIPERIDDDRHAAVERAEANGGTADPAPKQDYGVMYGRSVADPDGHIFEIMWMDPATAERGADAVQEAIATAV